MDNTRITDIDIPFGRLVLFVIKFNFAALAAAVAIGLPIVLLFLISNFFITYSWTIVKKYSLSYYCHQ